METDKTHKIIAKNRKAWRDYAIEDKFEAGIELLGTEVKSLREGKLNLGDAYARIENGQLVLKNLHISPYKMSNQPELDPIRTRRLLMHKREIKRLAIKVEQRGMTLILLTIYFAGKLVKVELGLGVGRKKYDKRQVIAKAESDRRLSQLTKRNLKE